MASDADSVDLKSFDWVYTELPADVEWQVNEAADPSVFTGTVPQENQGQEVTGEPSFNLLQFIKCTSCGEEPRHAVESPCCGEVWCWECLVEVWPSSCALCGETVSPDHYKSAKAIEKLLKAVKDAEEVARAVQHAQEPTEEETRIPCPDLCGAQLTLEEVEGHVNICTADLPCPNGCFAQLKRREFDHHLENDCPLSFIKCRYGCEEQVMRRDAEDHYQESTAKHLNMLLTRLEIQEQKNEKLQRSLNDTWMNPERLVKSVQKWIKGVGVGINISLMSASWPLITFILILIAAICTLPVFFMLVLLLQQLPPAISSVALPVGATLAVGITTFVFSLYCVLC